MIAIISQNAQELYKIAPILEELQRQSLRYILFQWYEEYEKNEITEILEIFRIKGVINLLTLNPNGQLIGLIQQFLLLFEEVQASIVILSNHTRLGLAAVLAAKELSLPVISIEAGLRSFDNAKNSEIYHRMIDTAANLLFTPSEKALVNLYYEGVEPNRAFYSGTTLIEALNRMNTIDSELKKKLKKIIE